MSPIIPSRYGHPKYNLFPQKSRAASLGGFKSNQRGTPGTDPKSRRKQRVEESKITVQPAEDEDTDNFYSKQLAAARFQRNHRLVNVLFSDIVVDQEQPSDNEKLQACKKRVKSLSEYQKKIDDEVVEINEKYNIKKARISEESKRFTERLSEFVSNSRKEISSLKAIQEIRRQQEATQRQLAIVNEKSSDKQPETSDIRPESAKRIKLDLRTSSDLPLEEKHRAEVGMVLNMMIESVANAV